jgi:hypothetical protein
VWRIHADIPNIADLGSRLAAVQQDVGRLEVGVDDIVHMQEMDSLQHEKQEQCTSMLLGSLNCHA